MAVPSGAKPGDPVGVSEGDNEDEGEILSDEEMEEDGGNYQQQDKGQKFGIR